MRTTSTSQGDGRLPYAGRLLTLILLVTLTWLGACSDSPPPAPVISLQPRDTSAIAGTAATVSVTASGPDIGYQWQLSTDGGTTWANIASATEATHTTAATTPADNGRRYRVVVSAADISLTSSAVTLTVTAAVVAPALTVQPAAQSAIAPAAANFDATASGTALGYQWQRSIDNGVTWVDIAGATAPSYSTGSTDVSMNASQYRVRVANSAGDVTSTAVLLSVAAAPQAAAITTQPADQSVSAGSAAAFTVTATGNPMPTLQWQRSTDNGATWTHIAAATDSTYNTGLTTLSQNGQRFRALASNSAGASTTSSAALLTVNVAAQAPAIIAQPASQSVSAPAAATFSATASGVPTPTWQWQLSTDGGLSFSNITGAVSPSYTTPATVSGDDGRRYRAVVANLAGTVNSTAAALSVTAPLGLQQTTLASATHAGGVPDNISGMPSLSNNGRRIAFTSVGTNLVAGAVVGSAYVRDLDTGTTVLVNRTLTGAASSRSVDQFIKISGNGRYVAFSSDDPNLVTGDTNGGTDMFVRDLQADTTVRVNLRADGAQVDGNGRGLPVDISADGRYVLFQAGSDLTGSGSTLPNGYRWFVRDLQGGTLTAITGFDDFNGAVLSGDGRFVSVLASAANVFSVRLYEVGVGERIVLSIPASDGFVGGRPALSRDGRYVAFLFRSAALLSGAAASANQIGVIDTQAADAAGTLELVSRTASGLPGDGSSSDPQLSADGRHVLFNSSAPVLTGGIGSGCCVAAAVVRDRIANTTQVGSRSVAGLAVRTATTSDIPAISADGGTVAFVADIGIVQAPGTPGGAQVFVAPRP